MQLLKQLLPGRWKLQLRRLQRHARDVLSGRAARFARNYQQEPAFPYQYSITQLVPATETAVAKMHNIMLAAERLNQLRVDPGQIFSFWEAVGVPAAARGYRPSRSIRGGRLTAETGGGLCQLSGLLYCMALKAGLPVTERHAHSVDIYTEAERFTPLGSDATVAYGYKDLRFCNNLTHPVVLHFSAAPGSLTGSLFSPLPLPEYEVQFICQPRHNGTEVITKCNEQIIAVNHYQLLPVVNRQTTITGTG